jgi:hypothetical protein
MPLSNWRPKEKWKHEDRLIHQYWQAVGGAIYTEVVVGCRGRFAWPDGSTRRRIDGVRFITPTDDRSHISSFGNKVAGKRFRELIEGAEIELLEVKKSLSRLVLGQVIIGADMLELDYAPVKVQLVVVCGRAEPGLELICERRGIKVWKPNVDTKSL